MSEANRGKVYPLDPHARGLREFAWWLDHPRLYRMVGFRWLCWRYRNAGIGIPRPVSKIPKDELAAAIELGRELAEKYGWR